MEGAGIRHHRAILEDPEFVRERPIGMVQENTEVYETISRAAGFRKIEIHREVMTFVSMDEEEW